MDVITIENLADIKANHPHLHSVYAAYVVDNMYRVYLAKTGKYTHIRVRRLDDKPICNFADLQEIKNRFLGEESVAVQVFPKVSRYINNSNTYHMFSWPNMDVPDLKELYQYL